MTIEQIMNDTVKWLITGELNSDMFAENFTFISPFWQKATRAEFIDKFKNSKDYQQTALAKITKFDPIIKMKSDDHCSFSIVLQYHTVNGSSVYEAVLGQVAQGKLVQLRSIYDLNETKKALDIN